MDRCRSRRCRQYRPAVAVQRRAAPAPPAVAASVVSVRAQSCGCPLRVRRPRPAARRRTAPASHWPAPHRAPRRTAPQPAARRPTSAGSRAAEKSRCGHPARPSRIPLRQERCGRPPLRPSALRTVPATAPVPHCPRRAAGRALPVPRRATGSGSCPLPAARRLVATSRDRIRRRRRPASPVPRHSARKPSMCFQNAWMRSPAAF